MQASRINLFFIFFFISIAGKSQSYDNPDSAKTNQSNTKVYNVVDQMPLFPGGEKKMMQYLSKIKYPKKARRKNITGRVYATFVVTSEGKVEEARILRGLGYGIDEEVLRVIKKMPDWIPGKQDGKNVNVQFNLPVNFNLR